MTDRVIRVAREHPELGVVGILEAFIAALGQGLGGGRQAGKQRDEIRFTFS